MSERSRVAKLRRPAALCVSVAVALIAGTAGAQFGPAPVVVVKAVEQEVSSGETFVGTVRPLMRATIGSAVDGRVIEFPISVGDRVSEGDTLAQLLTDTISLEVAAAEAELQLRKEELAELQNGSLPEEIEQARARMEAADALKAYLAAKRARMERLREGNAASEDVLQESISASLAADETFLESKAAWELAVQGPRAERIAQAQARVTLQQAMTDKLRDQLNKHTVITRFAGYVTQELTEIGAWVARGDPVAEVVALDTVEIEAFVLDQHVGYVVEGEDVQVRIPALPDRLFTGKVSAVVPQSDAQTRTFPVRVQVANEIVEEHPVIKAGMLARVTLQTGAVQKGILVPKDSIVLGGPTPLVFIAVPDAKDPKQTIAQPIPVEIGVATGEKLQVLPTTAVQAAFLKPGDQVVVLGNERLRPGQAIIVSEVREDETAASSAANQ
jgi:RND family efflux transporter MFP subunit